jgi:uncharacterized protein (TIRG00374 family)
MNLRKASVNVVKFVFVIAFLYFLAKRGLLSWDATRQAFSRTDKILPAFGLLAVNLLLGVVRWQWLLYGHGIRQSWRQTFQLSLIGNFFNIALPGAVTGDLVKAYYLGQKTPGKESGGQRSKAFGSILFDRVAGLSGLVLVCAGATIYGMRELIGTPLLQAIQGSVVFAAIAVFVFYGYLFVVKERHDPLLKFLKTVESRIPRLGLFARIYEGLRHYHNHRRVVVQVVLLSVVIHLMTGLSCLYLAQALGENSLPLLSIYILVPLGLLVTAVPVAPAGVGTGHAAFAYLFSLVGVQRGADIYTLFAVANLIFGGIGGIVYLQFKAHHEPMPSGKIPT